MQLVAAPFWQRLTQQLTQQLAAQDDTRERKHLETRYRLQCFKEARSLHVTVGIGMALVPLGNWESLTVFSMVFLSPNKMLLAYDVLSISVTCVFSFSFVSCERSWSALRTLQTIFSASISLCVLRFFALPPDCFHCACCADCVISQHVALGGAIRCQHMSGDVSSLRTVKSVRTCLPSVYVVSTEPRVSGQGCLPEGVETKRTIGSDWSLQQWIDSNRPNKQN